MNFLSILQDIDPPGTPPGGPDFGTLAQQARM